jgi:hypothetical protein
LDPNLAFRKIQGWILRAILKCESCNCI